MESWSPFFSARDRLEARSLAAVDDEMLWRFYTALLEPKLSPTQLMTYKELRKGLRGRNRPHALWTHRKKRQNRHSSRATATIDGTILLKGDEPIAGILTEDYLGGRVLLVTHLVVAATARSRGIGTQLLRGAVAGRAQAPLVLAEIEDPRYFTVSDAGDPVARVRFYERMGSRLLPLPYVQPSLRPGSPRVDGLLLIIIDALKSDVDGSLVAAFLDQYYSLCEGKAVLKDPAYLSLHAAALGDKQGRLPLLPLSALEVVRPAPHGGPMRRDRDPIKMSITLELEVSDKETQQDVMDMLETILPYMAENVKIQRNS